jgi:hypothetical protein
MENELNPDLSNLGDIINDVIHSGQPHTILGERGQQEMKLKEIQICECFLRGMLDGGTYWNLDENGNLTNNIDPEKLEYHHLIDIIYKVKWLKNFDPVAIVQSAGCHLEKVLGIYPNVPKLNYGENND